jgi:glycosyltransferase involved in cell wall biosynthesis
MGQNPAKAGIKAWQPHRLGIGIISYVPNQSGYFEESLQIIKIEIASLRRHTSEAFDLYLFDNGSCAEVQSELIKLNQSGAIDFLTLSHHNIGKFGAMNWLIASMTNEWIGYTDSDFYFRENWLQESLKLVEAFSDAGLVTAQPNIFDQLEGKSKALAAVDPGKVSVYEQLLETDVIEDYCRGIGATEEMRQKYLAQKSTLLENKSTGVKAVFGATTAQYLAPGEKIQQVFPMPHEFLIAREEDNELNRRIDAKGWLELSTLRPFVVHMGNHLDELIAAEAKEAGLFAGNVIERASTETHKNNPAWRMLVVFNRVSFLRKLFKRLYVNLFELYSIEKK